MTPILLDTGCIVALLDRSERYHHECAEAVSRLTVPLATCEAVIAEACWLMRHIRGAPDAILKNVEEGIFGIPFRIDSTTKAIRTLMKKYAKVPMDLADACLVSMADQLGTGRILTLDSDFRFYRWRRARSFELLIDLAK